jgi:hypothetical protein
MYAIRPAALAGSFYPADPRALREALADHLAAARLVTTDLEHPPKLLVVPHAGYIYSGDVAALAYAPLARWRGRIRRVVLLGPVHRVAVRGLAAPNVHAFETPLGRVPLDRAALIALRHLPQVVWADSPHAQEHSLEVQLPFLQAVLGNGFTLVPLLVGQAEAADVAKVLERLWGGDETLVVISSDLSHFLPYDEAQARDEATVERILHFATDLRGDQACGAAPLNGALLAARQHRLTPRLLGLRNSGDAKGGDRERVVGYAALTFECGSAFAANNASNDSAANLGATLLALARHSIAQGLGMATAAAPPSSAGLPALRQPGASFVSLRDPTGRMRGCIGQLDAWQPLADDVRANARTAAFGDPRFSPLRADEWPRVQVTVSVLGPLLPVAANTEAETRAALQPGVDGVVLSWQGQRATLLPEMWAQHPAPAQFLAALKRKAGMDADFWTPDLRLSRYGVTVYSDRSTAPT